MRERLDVLFVLVTFFISRIIFDFMTNGIFIRSFGRGIFFHSYRFPEVDGSSVEDSQAHLFVHCNLYIRTNSRIERWCKFTMHYAQNEEERKV
jgi:hypothetical protein